MTVFMRAGYEEIAPAVIQPAGPFLDAVGEALNGPMSSSIRIGEGLLPAPDITIPMDRPWKP